METVAEITATRVCENDDCAICVRGVTHGSSTSSACIDGVVWLRGKRAGRSNFIILANAWHYQEWRQVWIPGTAWVEGTRSSEADAVRFAAKLPGGRVVKIVEA